MKLALLAAASVAALTLAACNRTHTETETTATTPAADATAAATPATGAPPAEAPLAAANTAAGFAARVSLSDMYEIESSRLALERSQSAEVRRFAQMMIDGHTATTARLTEIVRTASPPITLPASLDRAGSDRMADLRSTSAEDFDDRYLDQQTEAHENTLALLRTYATAGDNTALQAMARETAPTVEQHLTAVRALDRGDADDEAGANAPGATTGASADGDADPRR